MWKFTQRSWVGGRLDAELMGRQDLAKYFQGASEIKNFSVRRQGNLSKRRGTKLAADLANLLGTSTASQGHAALAVADAGAFAALAEALGLAVDGTSLKDGTKTVATWDGSSAVAADGDYFGIGGDGPHVLSLFKGGYYVMQASTGDYVREWTGDDGKYVSVALKQHPLVPIGKARIIHLLRSEDAGFYLLFTAGRIFILNKDGIRLRNGRFVSRIPDFDDSDYGVTDPSAAGYRADIPYCAESGVADDFIGEIKYAQSGDTLVFVSHHFSPKRLVFDGEEITVTNVDFGSSTWAKPIVTSVASKPGSTWGDGATKTVYYACTYVKDGIESPMSDPVAFSYQLPWGNKCVVQIQVARGNNAVEPDYYNIYKQESAGYGLIATSGATVTVDVTPSATGTGAAAAVASLEDAAFESTRTGYLNNDANSPLYADAFTAFSQKANGPAPSSLVGAIPQTWLLQDAESSSSWTVHRSGTYVGPRDAKVSYSYYDSYSRTVPHGNCRFAGGVCSGSSVTFDFGAASGTRVSDIELSPDAASFFSGGNHYDVTEYSSGGGRYGAATVRYRGYPSQGMRLFSAGSSFTFTFNTKNAATGEEKAFTKTVSCEKVGGCVAGENVVVTQVPTNRTVSWGGLHVVGSSWSAVTSPSWKRTVKADAYHEIAEHYGSEGWYTTSIVVSTQEDGVACAMYWNGVKFANTSAVQDVYEDDYITPDLSSTPPESEVHFAGQADFPACVGFYKQRLCFANTLSDPFKFWMSCVGDLYNFNVHANLVESDAISATLAAFEFPEVNHIVVCRDVLMLTGGAEWKVAPVSGNTLSYRTVSADCQSCIGSSARLIPMLVGDEIVFADRNGTRLYATRYNWSSDGYDSADLSVLSQWLFKNNAIVDMSYSQYPDSTIDCVLADGTVATLVYMKEHEVCAWSRTVFGGGWSARGVACSKANVDGSSDEAFLVERNGVYQVWSVKPDIPVRGDAVGDTEDYIHLDAMRQLAEGEAPEDGMAVVNCNGRQVSGYPFDAELVTVRPEPQGSETIQFELKNAKDAEIRILDSGDFTVAPYGVGDAHGQEVRTGAGVGADGSLALASGDCRAVLVGNNGGDGRIRVTSRTALPLNILSVSVNYEIQPLSGSEG